MTDPRLDELLDAVPDEDRERLERIHAMLLAAGPPPELPPTLAEAPEPPSARVVSFPRRYRATLAAAAVVALLAVFGAGYLLGGASLTESAAFTVQMTGPGARASLAVFTADGAGNWPMRLTVNGLPVLEKGELYELWLTQGGKLAERCGTFVVTDRETEVRLNAPYRLRQFSGWVVTRAADDTFLLRTTTV